ncbi:tantalus [Musca autumnalis]|uniref:tantalus n=1 Tax=Musca autumnalis TaxID=221902 RepID=UPI003CF0BE4E
MMEGIVDGIANINFKQNTANYPDENCIPNFNFMQKTEEAKMALICTSEPASSSHDPKELDEHDCSNEEDEEAWQTDDDVFGGAGSSRKNGRLRRNSLGATFAERRQLPSRSSKENLTSIKRRTIMKPARHNSTLNKDFGNLKPSEIKKIYLNKKLTNFRPSSLETIFEEPPTAATQDADGVEYEHVRLIGSRKLRRVLTCGDGFVFNKALIKKRRAKIKKTFGRRLSLKKISLEEFLEKLNNSMEDNEDTEGNKKQSNTKIAEEMDATENVETEMDAILPITSTTTTTTPSSSLIAANDINAFSQMPQMATPIFLPTTTTLPQNY